MGSPQEWDSLDQPGLSAEELEAKLHAGAARQMLKWIEAEEVTAGQMQAILRFLKDNDVTALPIPGSQMERIAAKLSLPFRITDAGTEAESPRSDD